MTQPCTLVQAPSEPAAGDQPSGWSPAVLDAYLRLPRGDRARASVQRWQITQWMAARGWRLGRIFEELTSSAPSSPGSVWRQALGRVQSRESEGIVVLTLGHLGSSLADVLYAIELIEAAGRTFVSVSDGIDLSTEAGRTMLRLLLSVTEWWPS